MLRGSVLIGLLVVLVSAAPAAAAGPLFVLVTKSGSSESLSYFGYSFGTTLASAGTNFQHREEQVTYTQQSIIRPTLIDQFQMRAQCLDQFDIPGIQLIGRSHRVA